MRLPVDAHGRNCKSAAAIARRRLTVCASRCVFYSALTPDERVACATMPPRVAPRHVPRELQQHITSYLRGCAACGVLDVAPQVCAACHRAWCEPCARAHRVLTMAYVETRVPLCIACKYYLNLQSPTRAFAI